MCIKIHVSAGHSLHRLVLARERSNTVLVLSVCSVTTCSEKLFSAGNSAKLTAHQIQGQATLYVGKLHSTCIVKQQ